MRSIVANLKQGQRNLIDRHMPAKDAPPKVADIDKFKEAYDEFIVEQQDDSRAVEPEFHPSALGTKAGNCARRDVYLLGGVSKGRKDNAQLLRIFANGHAVHDRVQRALAEMGVLEAAEVDIDWADPPIKGHADGILNYNGRRILLEIKSANDAAFTARIKWKKPKDEHFVQANIYAYILGLDTIWVWYENKNDQSFELFEVKAKPEVAEKQLAKWRATYHLHLEGKLPKRPYKADSQACQSCDLRTHCWSDPELGE